MDVRAGSIVQAYVVDPEGRNPKSRPAFVIHREGSRLHVACISTQFDADNLEPFEVRMPHSPRGDSRSGLHSPSVVKCDWISTVEAEECMKIGFVPRVLANQIIRRVNEYLQS